MRDRNVDGLLLVDKPAGLSSHALVDRARVALGTRRIGHAGTLDPFATGLLILLVNRTTRLLPFLDAEPKIYHARIRFGSRTSTDDLEGTVIEEAPPPEQAVIERGIATLTGDLLQRPPSYSAKQVAGVRAYAAARRGKPLALEPVGVHVHGWRVLRREGPDLDAEITCSGGTYVRALARDLGEITGSAAHLAGLRRQRSGCFTVDQALSLEALERGAFELVSPVAAVGHLPRQTLDDLEAKRVVHGQAIGVQTPGDVAALCHRQQLLAVAVREGETWRPRVVMRDA